MPDLIDQYRQTFLDAGQEWNVDPTLLMALAKHEGNGDPNARGRSGEIGMTQIMPGTARHLGMTDQHDPVQQIWAAAKYMDEALRATGDNPTKALLYYNGGPRMGGDRRYPSYVAGNYAQYAKANTGSMTDASPAPAESTPPTAPDPAKMSDTDWLDAQSKTYPGLAGPNADRGQPADTGKDAAVADNGPSADDLLERMRKLAPGPSEGATGGQAAPGAQPSSDSGAPSSDDLLRRMRELAPPAETPAEAPADARTRALAAQDKTGAAADMGWNAATEPPPRSNALDDPTGAAADMGYKPGGDVRSWLAPAPGTTYADVLPLAKDDKTGAIRVALPNMLRTPLIGLTSEGPQLDPSGKLVVPGATINPTTGTLGVTPEAGSVATFAASPLRFSGANPMQYAAPGTLDRPTPLPGVAPVSAEAAARAAERPPGPTTETGIPSQQPPTPLPTGTGPQPAGAQVNLGRQTPLTEAERITNLEKTVKQTAEDRAGPQMRDDTRYDEKIPPRTLAGQDFNAQNALDEKALMAKDTAFRNEVDASNRARNQGMIDRLDAGAKDANALEAAHEARSQVSPDQMGVFENEQATDASGVLAAVDKELQGRGGKRDAVRSVLGKVRASLLDADGNLETSPSLLYGARQNITDLLKKGVRGTSDEADAVRAVKQKLTSFLPIIDDAITAGAPQFKQYLQSWSDLSKPIDRMEFLQKYHTTKLVDKDGYLLPTKVQAMLNDVLTGLKAKGPNAAKSLTEEEIDNIIKVRNELQAVALQRRLESVRGSDTFQQLNRAGSMSGPIGTAVRGVGELALGAGTMGVGTNILHFGIKPVLAARRANQIAAAEAARKAELLAPIKTNNPLTRP